MVERTLEDVTAPETDREPAAIEQFAQQFRRALGHEISGLSAAQIPETTPGVSAQTRLKAASQELFEDVDGFFARVAIAASLTAEERREILRGMVLTRAVDNRLKQLFTGSDVQFEGVPFQGKGFRSLGQEAIYAAAIRLKRGEAWRDRQRGWRGDVVGPIIRDLGVALAMHRLWVLDNTDSTVSELDPQSGRTLATVAVGSHSYDIAAGGDAVWAQSYGDRALYTIQPTTEPTH